MQYRCTEAFATADRVVASGALIDDGDPILITHPAHFAPVGVPVSPGAETASTEAPRKRGPWRPKKAVTKADGDDAPAATDK